MKINEKNLIAFSTVPPYDHEGFLLKRGEVNKALQRRYFILKGNLLFYFEKKGDREPLGLVLLEGCTIELSKMYNDSYCFEICFNGNRSYILCAESEESMKAWMHALASAGYEYKKLFISHLQQQLLELEDLQNKLMPKIKPIIARQPTQRHNPFDRTSEPFRPAPPPPPPKNGTTTPNRQSNSYRNTSAPLYFAEEHFPKETETTGNILQDPNRPQPYPRKKDIFSGYEPKSPDAVIFEEFHERIRTAVMKDVIEWRMRHQLIEF